MFLFTLGIMLLVVAIFAATKLPSMFDTFVESEDHIKWRRGVLGVQSSMEYHRSTPEQQKQLIDQLGVEPPKGTYMRIERLPFRIGGTIGAVLGLIMVLASTAIYVDQDSGGLVVKKFGPDLPPNRIVATRGEKGPQAEILPPGWHFGYWPWVYDLKPIKTITIDQGHVGVVTAMDGKPLPEGTVYADLWDDPEDMLDAQQFLSGEGHRGPQLTVLPPGKYRYNTSLFTITTTPALVVPVGQVAVIKADAGPVYEPEDGEDVMTINGTPIVPNGYRGIWGEPLTPNAYYMHPNAYQVTRVATTNRVYEYRSENAINVRTKDGFEFPVDLRIAVKIEAADAPMVVAQFARPDDDLNGNGFTTLEERAILPSIRAIFRDTAEARGAIEYVESRSLIQKAATEQFAQSIKQFRMQTDGVFVADIGLSRTEQGQALLKTQTDKEIAVREVQTYAKQKEAEVARAEQVRAKEEANQEQNKAAARARVDIAREDAKAAEEKAKGEAAAIREKAQGEAEAWKAKVASLGGVDNFVRLEIAKQAMERWEGDIPDVLVAGGGAGGGIEALVASMLKAEKKAE